MPKLLQKTAGLLTLAATALLLAPSGAFAQAFRLDTRRDVIGERRELGLGIDVGYPFTGLSLKWFMNERNALQFGLGYDFGAAARIQYVGHLALLGQGRAIEVPLYLGVGLGYTLNARTGNALLDGGIFEEEVFVSDYAADSQILNAHIPVGVAFQLQRTPIDFFIQAEPGLDLVWEPDSTFGDPTVFIPVLRVGLGGRVYF